MSGVQGMCALLISGDRQSSWPAGGSAEETTSLIPLVSNPPELRSVAQPRTSCPGNSQTHSSRKSEKNRPPASTLRHGPRVLGSPSHCSGAPVTTGASAQPAKVVPWLAGSGPSHSSTRGTAGPPATGSAPAATTVRQVRRRVAVSVRSAIGETVQRNPFVVVSTPLERHRR